MNQESSSHTVHMHMCVHCYTVSLLMALKLILLYIFNMPASYFIDTYLLITVICICLQNNKIAVIEEHFK